MTARASPVAPVAATSPRSMIAAFSRAIAVTVDPSRSVWSRPTLVTTATPPSQAWVASSRPPSPTSTSATSRADSAKCRNIDRGEQLELRRRSQAGRDPVGDGQHAPDETGEGPGIDRMAVDHDPLAIRHEVGLRRLADAVARGSQRGAGQRDHRSLAVGAGDQRAVDRELGVAKRMEQGPHPAQPEADAVPAPRLDRRQRLGIGEVRLGWAVSLAAGSHDFVSSSS